VIVEVGFTVVEPMRVDVLKEPGVMATDDAFVTLKERVLVPVEATMVPEAVKEEIEGGLLTVTVVDAVEVLFEVSVESAQRVVEPLWALVVFHDTEYRVPLGVEVEPIRVDVDMLPA
jgi:hypothetical protein